MIHTYETFQLWKKKKNILFDTVAERAQHAATSENTWMYSMNGSKLLYNITKYCIIIILLSNKVLYMHKLEY